jgi:hypothetical protein
MREKRAAPATPAAPATAPAAAPPKVIHHGSTPLPPDETLDPFRE